MMMILGFFYILHPWKKYTLKHFNHTIVFLQILEENIVTFVRTELRNFYRLLNPEHFQTSNEKNQMVNCDDEEKWSIKEAFVNLTLEFLRGMKQQTTAELLHNSKNRAGIVLIHFFCTVIKIMLGMKWIQMNRCHIYSYSHHIRFIKEIMALLTKPWISGRIKTFGGTYSTSFFAFIFIWIRTFTLYTATITLTISLHSGTMLFSMIYHSDTWFIWVFCL